MPHVDEPCLGWKTSSLSQLPRPLDGPSKGQIEKRNNNLIGKDTHGCEKEKEDKKIGDKWALEVLFDDGTYH
jgi:hypothetical protein